MSPQPRAAVELARFIRELSTATVPPDVLERARGCLLYGLGIGLLCMDEAYARVAEAAWQAVDGTTSGPGATAWRSGQRYGTATAAACNTVLMHSRCQEDTYGSAHLGIVVIPTALALIEAGYARPDQLILSLVAGYEAAGALERRLGRSSTALGFRASPLYGALAGAATAARLLSLDEAQTTAALANAAAFAGGTLQAIGDGTDEWRYQMAAATRRGLEAAFLARAGSRATAAALDGTRGFAAAFARTAIDLPLKPGDPWALRTVAFKPYPVCNRNQTVTTLAARIHDSQDLSHIRHVRFRISPFVEHGMLERGPFDSVAGTLMNTYFSCAAALAYGTVSRAMLEVFDDALTHVWIDRIDIQPDEAVPYPSAHADIEYTDGRRDTVVLMRSFADYALPRKEVLALLTRLARESSVDTALLQTLDAFAFDSAHKTIEPALSVFANARTARPSPHQEMVWTPPPR